MRILVTGKNGQLGRSIQKLVNTDAKIDINQYSNDFIFIGKGELDLSSESSIGHYFNNNDKFDVIINCAAYTAVDRAEEEQELANQVNHLAVKQLAGIAKEQKAKLIHISTDYVFDGESDKAYLETDETNPINVYGKTKLAGEKALQEIMPNDAIIIRTSWVYSEYGNNFVKTMLRLGKERDEINVVSDQIGSPTYATDLAQAIMAIVNSDTFTQANVDSEIYHYSNEGECSWYDFAKTIFELSNVSCNVSPIETKNYPTPATRPHYSLLNKEKIKKSYKLTIPYWKDSLQSCLKKLAEQEHTQ